MTCRTCSATGRTTASWSRRSGPFMSGGFKLRVVHCFWTFATMDDCREFLATAFADAGRTVAAGLKRPRLSYNVAIYHRSFDWRPQPSRRRPVAARRSPMQWARPAPPRLRDEPVPPGLAARRRRTGPARVPAPDLTRRRDAGDRPRRIGASSRSSRSRSATRRRSRCWRPGRWSSASRSAPGRVLRPLDMAGRDRRRERPRHGPGTGRRNRGDHRGRLPGRGGHPVHAVPATGVLSGRPRRGAGTRATPAAPEIGSARALW